MQSSSSLLGLRGHLLDAPQPGQLRSWPRGALVLGQGRILEVGNYDFLRKKPFDADIHWIDSPGVLILPGLVDLHTHLPQYPAVARGESALLPWLRQHIFPLEKDFTGPKSHAEIPWFFEELARHGTTTAGVFTAIFEDSCEAAFRAAERSGLRVIMGKMMMDVGSYGPHQPKKVVSISLLESERLCQKWHGAGNGLLEYAFSPRFAVSCSEKLMRGAGELAQKYGAYLQTHLAENEEEIEKVRNLFMWARSYTDVYDKCGLLGPRTLLGHCIHLDDEDRQTIARGGAAVAHCPTSNFFLGSGLMDLQALRAAGVRVGLGSDVAAGPELSLWQVMRSAIETSKARACYDKSTRPLTPADALHLATQGGADALGKGALIGSFEPGKEADLVVLDIQSMLPWRRRQKPRDDYSPEDLAALAVYRGGPHAVVETYVRGRRVYQAPAPSLF